MKKTLKYALVALAISVTAAACDPAKKTTGSEADSVTAVDSVKKDSVVTVDSTKADTIKKDSVKK